MDGHDAPVNWPERCMELELSLQRFRDQAGKIRGLLREKVSAPHSIIIQRRSRRSFKPVATKAFLNRGAI